MPKTTKTKTRDWMDPAWLDGAAECLRILAHPARLRMIELLTRQRCSVKEIAAHCAIPQNQACEHLRLMKTCGLLDAEKQGRAVFYRVIAPQAMSLLECMKSNCASWIAAPKPESK
jgi:ArsR family transcriptional regulator, zinc-responsive transcriptional repressor